MDTQGGWHAQYPARTQLLVWLKRVVREEERVARDLHGHARDENWPERLHTTRLVLVGMWLDDL